MTRTVINHREHDHPNTSAARAECRKALAEGKSLKKAPAKTTAKITKAPAKNAAPAKKAPPRPKPEAQGDA